MNKYKVAKLIAESAGVEYMNRLTPVSGKDLGVSVQEYELANEIWLVKFRMWWYANFTPIDWIANIFVKDKHGAREKFYVTGILEARKDNLSNSTFRITKECESARGCRISKLIGNKISVSIVISDYDLT